MAIAAKCGVGTPHRQHRCYAAERCASSSAVALHRSPPAFLVTLDVVAIALQSAGNRERCLRVLVLLDVLVDQSGE
jgi:hypothetical protein